MSAQVYSVPGQIERPNGRPFRTGKAYIYPLNYILYMGVMLTIMKVFIILFLLMRIGNIQAIFKTNH